MEQHPACSSSFWIAAIQNPKNHGYPCLKVLLVAGRPPVGITAVGRANLDPDSAVTTLGSQKKA